MTLKLMPTSKFMGEVSAVRGAEQQLSIKNGNLVEHTYE